MRSIETLKKQLAAVRDALPPDDEEVGFYIVEFDALKLLPDELAFIESLPYRMHTRRNSYLIDLDLDHHAITREQAQCLDEITDRLSKHSPVG